MQPESHFAEANGIRLHYLAWGDPASPPLVLLHATGFLAALWQPVAERLAGGYAVYAYDVRGHGDSDKPESAYHWINLVNDLRGFLDALGARALPVVGHSSGGAAALYLAATHPEYISRVVAYEPIIVPAEMRAMTAANPMAATARKRRSTWPNTGEMITTYRTRPAFATWRDDVLRLYAEQGTFEDGAGEVRLKCPPEVEAQLFENSASLDWTVLPRVRCPVLLIAGERTDAFLQAAMRSALQQVPRSRAMTLSGAGHLGPMERPDAVADIVVDFLGGTA